MAKENPYEKYLLCFLRGVNVNGRTMKMAEVCEVFQQAKMADVSSVLVTGNILFRTSLAEPELRESLEKSMSDYFAFEVHILLKDKNQIENILQSVPFEPNPDLYIYAFICCNGTESALAEHFSKVPHLPMEEGKVSDESFYWKVPKGSTLDSAFSKALGRKDIKNKCTSRNINTIEKIYKKMNSYK